MTAAEQPRDNERRSRLGDMNDVIWLIARPADLVAVRRYAEETPDGR